MSSRRLEVLCPFCKRRAEIAHTTIREIPAQEYLTGSRGLSKAFSDKKNHSTFRPWIPLHPSLVPIEKRDKEQKIQKDEARTIKYHLLKCAYDPIVGKDGKYSSFDSRHMFVEVILQSEVKNYFGVNGTDEAWDFQKEGVDFAARSGWRCLIADEPGLGKTIQSSLIINNAKLFPTIVAVKSSIAYNWMRELEKWHSDEWTSTTIIRSSKQKLVPSFEVYIISMDLLGKNGMADKIAKELKPKMLIVDEAHALKDPGSNRTKAVVRLCQEANIEHRIFLSGTPVLNRADEYFTILNLIDPLNFPSESRFKIRWLDMDGKRIRPYLVEQFHDLIAKYVIRRPKSLVNLPPQITSKIYYEIEDADIKAAYNAELDLISNWLRSGNTQASSNTLIGYIMRLRAWTGRAKIPRVLEMVEQFLDENDPSEKLAIGVEHDDVRDTLYVMADEKKFKPLKISGEDNSFEKDRAALAFNEPDRRLMIINMKAGGEGMNLQMCSNTYLAERPWSYAKEIQYIARYHRPGQKKTVYADIIIAKGTMDEWIDEKITQKEKIFKQVVDGQDWDFNPNELRDLLDKAINHRL